MTKPERFDPTRYLVAPDVDFDQVRIQAFEGIWETIDAHSASSVIDYACPFRKFEFLTYLVRQKGVLLHGSNDPGIAQFKPRQQTDFRGRVRESVFATDDGIWPIYFAIVDRERVRVLKNACFQVADEHLARWARATVDLQRGLDLITSRPDVDPRRLGYVGHSYGATLDGVLAGIETRVKAYVLMAGLVAHSEWWRNSDHEYYRHFREQVTPEQLDDMVETMATVDAIHFAGHAAPAALLFQFAHHDRFIPEQEALRHWQAASEPKEIRWYDADHSFNDEARQDRIAWLSERHGLLGER